MVNSFTPALSHPSLCALAERHPRPKQCDLSEALPPPAAPQPPPICRPLPVCGIDVLSPADLLFFTAISRRTPSFHDVEL